MLSDRRSDVENLLIAIKSDVTLILQSYMRITAEDVKITFEAEDGSYKINIFTETDNLIPPGKAI